MMRLRQASVMATLSVLAWATTAGAECAWVLWADHITPRDEHSIIAAYGTETLCKSSLPRVAADMAEARGLKVVVNAQSHVIMGEGSLFSLRCLPDTVDPRGPKGKVKARTLSDGDRRWPDRVGPLT